MFGWPQQNPDIMEDSQNAPSDYGACTSEEEGDAMTGQAPIARRAHASSESDYSSDEDQEEKAKAAKAQKAEAAAGPPAPPPNPPARGRKPASGGWSAPPLSAFKQMDDGAGEKAFRKCAEDILGKAFAEAGVGSEVITPKHWDQVYKYEIQDNREDPDAYTVVCYKADPVGQGHSKQARPSLRARAYFARISGLSAARIFRRGSF